ncbi:uncharacterized protein MONOS_4969 [Monocercomonoides exilis]|uniref:uncharacterized protein n=1 Tax=Monocercomonoides exilis TaxID=2049356 RepID=UPI00355AAE61|nr:hypothetical protein MONOS_4969 [Monocercomonoides exilis]|eukprot:MONOS_4969.1-p1 / transcript=MONOS_4969.1 / gene=MONOS_4969 / organism=Monocercomonoides_exilis_PA203 / gene_product=unspecified product / transcript_product=unspecified product / location=Mono_scaffold00139:63049-64342(-) / protein_length=400 / sequence_SO=supercontig / SO=protein_coding / is_pseudo=false
MNEVMEEMEKKEIKSILTEELFDKILKMTDEKKLNFGNAILLLKYIGYCSVPKRIWNFSFGESSLNKRFEKMIIDENEKNEGKNEKLLVDLCECYLLLYGMFNPKLLLICSCCLLKVALNKEENEETQKEVEMALLSLSHIYRRNFFMDRELHLSALKEIIQNHLEHRNLTHLAYQMAWEFFIDRFFKDESLKGLIANELHFVREATRELDELTKCADWERNEEEGGGGKTKEVVIIMRWLEVIQTFFFQTRYRNEEYAELISSIVNVFRKAKAKFSRICRKCIYCIRAAVYNSAVKIEDLLESEAVDVVLEASPPSHVDIIKIDVYLDFFKILCGRLTCEEEIESDEAKRKELKRKVLEKMEAEGFEDYIIQLHCCKIVKEYNTYSLVENTKVYFVYC